MNRVDALPEGSHLLHIGPQKTGSTAIQAALHHARDVLREHGVVYPGPGMRPAEAAAAGLGFPLPRGAAAPRKRAWRDLLAQVSAADALRVCVSHEAFGRATDEQAEQVVRHLGGDRPHVLAVARRYDRLMPSQWQQRVKAGDVRDYETWLRVILSDRVLEEYAWVPHDTPRLVERWARYVGPENVTVVVSDDADRDLLPRTFERLLDVPEGTLRSVEGRGNRSLTYPEVELLRRVNQVFRDNRWSERDYFSLVKKGLVPQLVRAPAPEGPRIPDLPDWARERVAELSDRRVEGLNRTGVRVVGDLEALRVDVGAARAGAPYSGTGAAPVAPTVDLETAVQALEAFAAAGVAMRKRARRQARRRAHRGDPGTVAAAQRPSSRWLRLAGRVKR